MTATRKIIIAAGLVARIGAALLVLNNSGGDGSSNNLLITPRAVERRDLADVLTVSGEVRRDETKKINSAVDGKVSQISVEDGDTVEAGDGVFALDGRTAVAVAGDFSFYRELSVGSVGPDVKQLETILNDNGYPISSVDSLFTEQTRSALARWQFDRGYSGSANESDETVTVSLSSNSAAYSVGRANTAAFVVTPSVPSGTGSTFRGGGGATKPTLTVSASSNSVIEGDPVTFTVTSDISLLTDLTVALTIGGSAAGGDDIANDDDYEEILTNIVLPAGELTVSVTSVVFVDSVIEGYNGTVFAYGQTGSGKTFTITGGAERYVDRGIIPRALSYIFGKIADKTDTTYEVRVSYLEIYNEAGYDLLDPSHETKGLEDLPKVTLQEDHDGRIHLRNLSAQLARNEEEALNLLFVGDTNRMISETPMNMASSRSHCIFTISIEARPSGSDVVRRSKLHLVDLAGSERVKKTGIEGTVLREARYINLSLHYLEQVIVALQEKKFVPYRNSMMTSVLRDSLGGNCKTVMVATLSSEEAR